MNLMIPMMLVLSIAFLAQAVPKQTGPPPSAVSAPDTLQAAAATDSVDAHLVAPQAPGY